MKQILLAIAFWVTTAIPLSAENSLHLQQLFNTRDCRNCELSGINLSGINLSGANLNGVNLSGANLSGANLNGASLLDANLMGANLSSTSLIVTNLSGPILHEADLRKFHKIKSAKFTGHYRRCLQTIYPSCTDFLALCL